MIRLSIIVPFYNVEQYLEECIRSLYTQDIPQDEYEVICVDDCSPDDCSMIVKRLQQEYTTLRLITHSHNRKLGGARNSGLKAANGMFVWFVDSDDNIYPNVLKKMLNEAEKDNVDLLQFDFSRGGKQSSIISQSNKITNGETYLFQNTGSHWCEKIGGVWRQLFRREFLECNNMRYVENVMYEDTDYLLHAFLVANKVRYLSILAYNYRINPESITASPISPLKLAWRVNSIARCCTYVDLAKTDTAVELMGTFISQSLSSIRTEIKLLTQDQKREYRRNLVLGNRMCKQYINWRTWFAIRYGITWFV